MGLFSCFGPSACQAQATGTKQKARSSKGSVGGGEGGRHQTHIELGKGWGQRVEREDPNGFSSSSSLQRSWGHSLPPWGTVGRKWGGGEGCGRGSRLEAVDHLSGLGLGHSPHANYLSESLKVWSRHKEAASLPCCLPSLPSRSPPTASQPNKRPKPSGA